MAETKTNRSPARKVPASRKRPATGRAATAVDRTARLSEDVLDSVEAGQRAAIDAVRKFTATVDDALPAHGDSHSKRQDVVDSAMEMADRLVHAQYDFIRKVIASAGKEISRSNGGKSDGKQ
jgi:hypothetical protein